MTWWHYLLLVNIYLLLFYGFYFLLLRRETFFQLNRIYLISASILSFFIPMIQSNWVKDLFITKEVQLTIYNSPLVVYHFRPIIQDTQLTFGDILAAAYLLGMLFLIGRFVWQMIALNKIMNQPAPQTPFSFFKKVKLNAEHENNQVISAHEHVHAKQWHSADVLLIEAVMIVNWFNPIVYLYRYTIKHIHEYIADRQAVKFGTNKSEYALLLVSQTFNAPAHKLVNPFFNHSLLKQRILMLQKNRSKRVALVKYGLSAPLFMLMLVLSSATVNNSKTVGFVNKKVAQVMATPASEPSGILDSSTTVQDNAAKNAPISSSASRTGDHGVIGASRENAISKDATEPEATIPAGKDITDNESSPIFVAVERVPVFPGGIEAFYQYLARNIRYPAAMRDAGVQGKVIVAFVVEKDGSLTDVRVTRGVAADIDLEALRVIQESPKWTPGIQNGRPVRVAYSVPIAFNLVDNDNTASVAPVRQNGRVPAVRVNTVSIKPDTAVRNAPANIKDLPTGAQVKPNDKESNNANKLNRVTTEKLGVLPEKESAAAGVKAPGEPVLHRISTASLGRFNTY